MVPRVVGFRRSGNHLLMALLFHNCETGAASAEELHYSHTLADPPYVCIRRRLLPTMLSFWRMRERFGVSSGTTFSEMMTVPYHELPPPSDGVIASLDGHDVEGWHRPAIALPLPEQWIGDTRRFVAGADAVVDYDELVANPLGCVFHVARCLNLKVRWRGPVLHRVGWWMSVEEQPAVSEGVLRRLRKLESML